MFPYYDKPYTGKKDLNTDLGLTPGIEIGKTTPENYKKSLKNLIRYLEGDRVKLLKDLENQMKIDAAEGRFEDAAIILADSGMLQSTAEKKHLLLTLYSGEWFENMKATGLTVPYRRETFAQKRIVLDFDADFNMTDVGVLANNAKGKSLQQIRNDVDSLNHEYDSIGRAFYQDAKRAFYTTGNLSKQDSLRAVKMAATKSFNIDTVINRLSADERQRAMSLSRNKIQTEKQNMEFKSLITSEGDRVIRSHHIWAIDKFTLSLSCLLFFFIGAPLGAIIRKGGLGIPVIISVLVFIIYYILDNTGYQMSRRGIWAVWFGKGIATAVLTPVAVFFTYKANNDSVVFNLDLYRTFMMKMLGLRLKRHVMAKEVIIEDPHYKEDAEILTRINEEITTYAHEHKLYRLPNPIKVFFKYEPDHKIEHISEEMEKVIDDLANTRDKVIMTELNHFPVVSTKAHTRPFERRWMNIVAAVIIPVGLFLYLRMWSFRLRLYRDLKTIKQTSTNIVNRIHEMVRTE